MYFVVIIQVDSGQYAYKVAECGEKYSIEMRNERTVWESRRAQY
jgi:hypothetical protein